MDRVLGSYAGHVYALLRIVAGFLFACHGAQKLFGALGGVDGAGGAPPIASLYGLAGIIEFFGGLLIGLGLFTGWAAFIASGEMAFAYFMAHAPTSVWPVRNGGEPAVLFCFLFLYVAARGSGAFSLDRAFGRRG